MAVYLNLQAFRVVNVKRCEEAFEVCKDWTLGDWGNALAGEVGELCNLLKKTRRGEYIDKLKYENEIADVFTYLDLIAAKLHIDLSFAVKQKFLEVDERVGWKLPEDSAPWTVKFFSPELTENEKDLIANPCVATANIFVYGASLSAVCRLRKAHDGSHFDKLLDIKWSI